MGFHTAQCTEWQAECASHTQGSLKDRSPLGEGPQVGCLRKPQVRGVDNATTPCFQKTLLHRSSIRGRTRKRRPPDEAEVPSNTGELGIRRKLTEVLGRSKWHHHSLRPWNLMVQLVGAAVDLAKLLVGQTWEIPSFPQEPVPGLPACPSHQLHRKSLIWSRKKLLSEPRHLQLQGRPVLPASLLRQQQHGGCFSLLDATHCSLSVAWPLQGPLQPEGTDCLLFRDLSDLQVPTGD